MDFRKIMEFKSSLLKMRRIYQDYKLSSDEDKKKYYSVENMEKLGREILVIDGYVKYAEFANKLNLLYERRKNCADDKIEGIDKEIADLTEKDAKFFGLAYFKDLAKIDEDKYKELKEEYPIKVTRPETFYKSIGVESIVEDQQDIDVEIPRLNDEHVDETVVEENKEDITVVPQWHPDLTEEQVLDAKSKDIFEPAGPEYEQYLGEVGLEQPTEEPKEEVKEDTTVIPQWDSRLTGEQILEAYQRDIFEPVGPEYEQYLNELGLGQPVVTEESTITAEPTSTEEVVEDSKEDNVEEPVVENEQPIHEMTDEEVTEELNNTPEDKDEETNIPDYLEPIEYIPGTDIPRPRYRLDDEKDEDYVKFLEDYYSKHTFNKTEEKNNEEPTKTEEPVVQSPLTEDTDNNELFRGDIGRGMPTPEEQFKQGTGIDFDPEKHEINYNGAVDDGYDDPYTPFTITEKKPKEEVTTETPEEPTVTEEPVVTEEPDKTEEPTLEDETIEEEQVEENTLTEDNIEPKKELPSLIYPDVYPDFNQMKSDTTEPKKELPSIVYPYPNFKPQTNEDPEKEEIEPKKELPAIIHEPPKVDNVLPNTIESVLAEISKGIDLTRGARQQIVNSEIRVAKNFVNKIKQNNNWVYNVLYIPGSLISTVVGSFKQVGGEIYKITHPRKVADLEEVRRRLRELPEEKIEIIRNEYDTSIADENPGLNAIEPLIYERLIEYVETKYNQPDRNTIRSIYKDLAARYKKIQQLLIIKKKSDNPEEQMIINMKIQEIASGSAQKIATLKETKERLKHHLNDGYGLTSLAQSIGSADNNANRRGRIFAKRYSTGQVEDVTQTNGEQSQKKAARVMLGNDYGALDAFMEDEKYKIDNTIIENSIVGKRSVGKYEWSAVPKQTEVGPDPLLGYIIRTIAVAGIAKGIISEIHNMGLKPELMNAKEQIKSHNEHINDVNAQNQVFEQQVHQAGDDLEQIGAQNVEGLHKAALDSNVGKHSVGEYSGLVKDGGVLGKEYFKIDKTNHPQSTEFYNNIENTMVSVKTGLSNGTVTIQDAIRAIGERLDEIQAAKKSLYEEWDFEIRNNPDVQALAQKYDYTAVTQSLPQLIKDNSLDITIENMAKSVDIANGLQGIQMSILEPLKAQIPTDIQSQALPIIASAVSLGYLDKLLEDAKGLYTYSENEDEIRDAIISAMDVKEEYKELLNEGRAR